jgi:hypothetical protein
MIFESGCFLKFSIAKCFSIDVQNAGLTSIADEELNKKLDLMFILLCLCRQ